jgi:hypothetical protein
LDCFGGVSLAPVTGIKFKADFTFHCIGRCHPDAAATEELPR